MHFLKKLFSGSTGYWVHKLSSLPIGADIKNDIHRRLRYENLDTLFDVGANVGQTKDWFRNLDKSANIYCFEPVTETFEILKSNISHDPKCIIENIAFGSQAGEKLITLFDHDSSLNTLNDEVMNSVHGARSQIIRIETIDDYCRKNNIKKIDILKIDTEGYEIPVLEGAKQMMQESNIPLIFCEVGFNKSNNRNTFFGDLCEWLNERGYNFFGLYNLVASKNQIEFGNAMFVHKDLEIF